MPTKMPYIVRGKEKFWNALLGGGMVTVVTVFALWAVSGTGAFEPPGPEEIRMAVVGFVAGTFAATLAYLSPNSPVPGSGTELGVLAERLAEVETLERQWKEDLAALRTERAALATQKPPQPEVPQPSPLAQKPAAAPRRPAERTDE